MNKKEFLYGKSIYIAYTVFFICVSALIIYCFHAAGKTLICYGDAYIQGMPGVVKEIRYLKDMIRHIFTDHRLEVPLIDYEIGFGMDAVVNSLHDPIVLLGVFCPEKYYVRFYQLVPFALLYLAGLAFLIYCRKIHLQKDYAVWMGCMVYLFGGYALFSLTRYLSFIYPLVYLPLCLSGAEDVIQKKKTALFALSAGFLFTVSWYYGYMVSIFVVLYCFVRLYPMLKKKYYALFVKKGFQLAGVYLLGIMLSGVWLLPGIYGYLNSSRTGEHTDQTDSLWHYGMDYYKQFFSGFAVPNTNSYYEMFTGYLPAAFLALVILFAYAKKRKYRIWKCLFLFTLIFAAFPIFGKLFNGGGYVSNRWCFCMLFVLSVITAAAFSALDEILQKQMLRLSFAALGAAAMLMVMAFGVQDPGVWAGACVLSGYAYLLIFYRYPILTLKKKERILSGFTICSAVLFIIVNFHPHFSDYHQRFLPRNEAFHMEYLAKAGNIEDSSFYRISAPWNETNFSQYYGFYGTSGYTNLMSKYVSDFFTELALNTQRYSFQLTGIDGRAVLNDLFAVKYHVSNSANTPYGFVYSRQDASGILSAADHKVSPVRLYDTCMLKEDYMKLEPLQRQEALSQTVILDEKPGKIKEALYEDHYTALPYRITDLKDIQLHGNVIQVNSADARMTIAFDAADHTETYLNMRGLKLLSEENILTVYTNTEGYGNRFLILNEKFQYYVNDKVTVNLGYSEKGPGTCTLAFSGPGRFYYDSMEVLSYPMEVYEQYAGSAGSQDNYDFQIGNNQFTCSLDLADERVVQFSIPYSIGWKAYVDGKETEIYQSDTMFMSVSAGPGTHKIRFEYCTPLLKQGIVVSAAALVVLILGNWKRRRK